MAANLKMATILCKMVYCNVHLSSVIFLNKFHYLCVCVFTKITLHILKSKMAILPLTLVNQGGLLQPPPWIFANEPPMNLVLVSIDSIGLLYPYLSKWVQSDEALRSYDVIKHRGS